MVIYINSKFESSAKSNILKMEKKREKRDHNLLETIFQNAEEKIAIKLKL
jgi:hypothetical protein